MKRLIGGIVARYQEIFDIEIYCYCFLGNHYHLLIRALRGNADEFCENVNREIARRLNYVHHREGKFWGRRYDEQQVLTEDDLLKAFLYITTNPTHHGLLQDSSEWPGLSSYQQSLTGEAKVYSFYHYSCAEEEGKISTHTLKLSPLPQHKDMSQKERRNLLSELIREKTKDLVAKRKEQGMGFLGLAGLRSSIPGELPHKVARSKRPPCYTGNFELMREFRKQNRYRRELYDEASMRYRLGDATAQFPEHTFKPPLHRAPRVLPFKPLTLDDLKCAA